MSPRGSCPGADTLAALDALDDASRAEIVDHAASCPDCRPVVMAMIGTSGAQGFAEAATLASTDPRGGPSLDVPPRIDRYRVERRIGEGAMGVVFAAYDPELARPVAVKVLRAGASPERMRREAQALAKLTHPNVVAVYDVGDHDGATFVTMALVDGENLRTWLAGERTTAQIVDAILQAARGVEAAHRAGIVHRDIKPDNIFVAKSGAVLVGDFGLAYAGGESAVPAAPTTDSAALTRTGAIVGTPAYMAPEQTEGEASEASDQFALCVTAWEALHGARPFTGASLGELAKAMRGGAPPDPRTREVPVRVRAAIRRGLSPDPAGRFPSMAAFIAALTPHERRRWPYVAIALAAVGGAAAAIALRTDPQAEAIARCEAQPPPRAWTDGRRAYALAELAKAGLSAPVRALAANLVDRYAAEWTALARSSCIAKARREVSDPVHETVMRCLDRRAAVIGWTFEEPTLEPMARLVVIEGLEPVDICRATEARPAPVPALVALQHDLDRAFAQVIAGNADLVDVRALRARADEVADPGAAAEALYLEAVFLQRQGHDPGKQVREAIAKAEGAHDDRIRTRAIALYAGALAKQGRAADSASQLDLAKSALARSADALTKLAVEQATVSVARGESDLPAELAAAQRIEQLELARLGDPSMALAHARFNLAEVMQRARRPEGAAMLERAFATQAVFSELTKDSEPNAVLLSLVRSLHAENTPAGQVAIGEQILAIARQSAPDLLPLFLGNVATANMFFGDYERAVQYAQESIALLDKQPATADEQFRTGVIETLVDSALAAAEQTDDGARRARYAALVHAALAQLPPPQRDVDYNRSALGRVLLVEGRYAEAIPPLTESLAAAERQEPQIAAHITLRAFSLARALWETGGARERDRARALAQQAETRIPDARAFLQTSPMYVSALGRLERLAAQIPAWRRAHP